MAVSVFDGKNVKTTIIWFLYVDTTREEQVSADILLV